MSLAFLLSSQDTLKIRQTILAMQSSQAAEQVRQNVQILTAQRASFRDDAELCGIDQVLIDTAGNQQYHKTNKNRMLMERSNRYVYSEFSNVDLHVYGHGYADAHNFVCSFAAFPEHPGSNVSLLNHDTQSDLRI